MVIVQKYQINRYYAQKSHQITTTEDKETNLRFIAQNSRNAKSTSK